MSIIFTFIYVQTCERANEKKVEKYCKGRVNVVKIDQTEVNGEGDRARNEDYFLRCFGKFVISEEESRCIFKNVKIL